LPHAGVFSHKENIMQTPVTAIRRPAWPTWILGGALLLAGTAHAFELHSKAFADQGTLAAAQVYRGFGCEGGNVSPQIAWSNPPAGTKSFALTAYDPDAPTGSGWWHWVVYDIPANISTLDGNAGTRAGLPQGAHHGRNDFGTTDFGGACPPAGDQPHRYVFTVHALKVETLGAPADASPALIGFMLHANSLGSAALTARYGR
jgi:Raf kinase inhibitor-like YbhB/YbcL family protein